MKLSLGSWSFSFGPYADHPVPFDEVVKRLARAGYDGIEICGFPPHVTVERYQSAASRRELADLLRGHNLGVSGYDADFSLVNPSAADRRERYLELFRRNLDLAAALGAPTIRVDSGGAPGALDDKEYASAFARVADTWHAAAELAGAAKVKIVWEFEPGFIFNKPSEVIAMHERVAHPAFQVLFDTCHAHMCGVVGARQQGRVETLPGGLPEFLRKLSGRIGALHLIDSDGTLYCEETSTHCPLGEGEIHFAAIAPALRALPVEWCCIDMCFCAGSWELVERELEFARDLLA